MEEFQEYLEGRFSRIQYSLDTGLEEEIVQLSRFQAGTDGVKLFAEIGYTGERTYLGMEREGRWWI